MTFSIRLRKRLCLAAIISILASGPGYSASHVGKSFPEASRLGRRIFFDASLSSSGKLSCASCHDPKYAYAAPNRGEVQLGGADMRRPGTRAVPSLRYTLRRTPIWSDEFQSDPIEQMLEIDKTPVGGFDWDGRFNTLHEQAEAAFLATNQSDNGSRAAFVARLAATDYAADFRAIFGIDVSTEPDRAFALAAWAVERFELEDPSFYPYSSRFDDFLDGKAMLSTQEKHGLALFVAADKGNCAACHIAANGADGSHPLFTDFGFQTLGVPRNPAIPANQSAAYFDLGLCGPQRTDLANQDKFCGMFKTPSLRNVATRRVFFHNGKIHGLREAVRFYVTRERDAPHWYHHGADPGQRYDDLPVELRGNVDHFDAPFNRGGKKSPALSEAEISDLLAFLETLTDRDAEIPP